MNEPVVARLAARSPRALLTLGSGLGGLAETLEHPDRVSFADLGLPSPTVAGHAGHLVAGMLRGTPVLVQQGRLHLYEGVGARDVTAAVRLAADMGVGTFVVTNAAGGLREDMRPGDALVIADHLNLTGTSPLTGAAPAFVDLTDAYEPALRAQASAAATEAGVRWHEGVYAGLVGPAYETPAEVRMLRHLGADAVGMSTVLEVIEARRLGLRVLGLSLLTNVHRPGGTPTDHADVLAAAGAAGPRLARVVAEVVGGL